MGDSFHRFHERCSRPSNRASCSMSDTSSQYLMMWILPVSTSMRSKRGTSSMNASYSSLVQKPITRWRGKNSQV